jgi:hypothetical protein
MMAKPKIVEERFTPALLRRVSRAVADLAALGYARRVLRGYSIDLLPDSLEITLDVVDDEKNIIKNFSITYDMIEILGKGGAVSIETLFLVELGRLLPKGSL